MPVFEEEAFLMTFSLPEVMISSEVAIRNPISFWVVLLGLAITSPERVISMPGLSKSSALPVVTVGAKLVGCLLYTSFLLFL